VFFKTLGLIFLAGCALSACGDPAGQAKQLAAAQAATGAALEPYSDNITHAVDIGKNADLVQRFCKNATGQACPVDIAARLKTFGFADGQDGVKLAGAFVLMDLHENNQKGDADASDEEFLAAAYRVAFGRAPDEMGGKSNLAFIKETHERYAMLRSLLQSPEFKRLK
jgi:Domain of unknown function (DUF4214)